MSSQSPSWNAVKLKASLRHALPTRVVTAIQEARTLYWFMKDFRGQHIRTCPICDYRGRFFAYGNPPRYDAVCKNCRSLERHRLIKLWLDREAKGLDLGYVLHFAPEDALIPLFRAYASKYAGADIQPGRADLVLNIERLDLADASVDTVVASQILEHVDDALALQEIARVLKPGGRALLMTPVIEGWNATYENKDVNTPQERLLHFGQDDHVRYFGRDVRERIKRAGFTIAEFTAVEPDVRTYGLVRGETLFIAIKPNT